VPQSSSRGGRGGPPAGPGRMPVDADKYRRSMSLTNFVNAYYQIRDAMKYEPQRVLVVGVGTGIEPLLLKHKCNVQVTTYDIDERFAPDHVGSVHAMSIFDSGAFDVAIVSHVLEHLPFSYLDTVLRELARVAKHVVLYLPYGGRHLRLKFIYAQRVREYVIGVDVPPLNKIDGERPELQAGHHYWEVGYRGFSLRAISGRIAKHFVIDERYHNADWMYSINFLLTSRLLKAQGIEAQAKE